MGACYRRNRMELRGCLSWASPSFGGAGLAVVAANRDSYLALTRAVSLPPKLLVTVILCGLLIPVNLAL